MPLELSIFFQEFKLELKNAVSNWNGGFIKAVDQYLDFSQFQKKIKAISAYFRNTIESWNLSHPIIEIIQCPLSAYKVSLLNYMPHASLWLTCHCS